MYQITTMYTLNILRFFQLYLNKADILSTYVFGSGHGTNLHKEATTEEFSSLKGFD